MNIENSPFAAIRKVNEAGNEYWSSRDFAAVLEYIQYRNFEIVIDKAKTACFNSGQRIEDHFVNAVETIEVGNNAQRVLQTVLLSRYACYLIIQNADPSKKIVANGQTYFAVQTRLQELNEQQLEASKRVIYRGDLKARNLCLAEAAKEAGVIEPQDFAIFQNHGYMGLYGGLDAKGIHARKGLKKNQHILDHMGSAELAANIFRASQTDEKLRREKIQGKTNANRAHNEVGKKVRQTIKELGGTMPEDLPVAESIKKLSPSTIKNQKLLDI